MDLQKYLDRLSLNKDDFQVPSYSNLCKLQDAHLERIVFENFDNFSGKGSQMNLEWIFDKVINRKRGGFCLETNAIFGWLLDSLGYDVSLILGEVVIAGEENKPNHLGIHVKNLEGFDYLAEVGMGALGPQKPLKILMDETQCCENGIFKYVRKGESENVFYQCRQKRRPDEGNWELICKFMLDEAVPFSELQSIQEVCDRMQDSNGQHRIQSTPLAHVRLNGGKVCKFIAGNEFSVVEYPNPESEVRSCERKNLADKEVETLMSQEFGLKLDFKIKFSKNISNV